MTATSAADGGCTDDGENLQDHYGFLLNVSLHMIAPTGVPIQAAVALTGTTGSSGTAS